MDGDRQLQPAVPRRAPTFELPRGTDRIGGWLLLFLITQGVSALYVLSRAGALMDALSPDAWVVGNYVPHYRLLAVVELVMGLGQAVLAPIGIAFAIRRSRRTPLFFETLLAAMFAYQALEMLVAPQVFGDIIALARRAGTLTPALERSGDSLVFRTARGMGYAALWFFYWLRSSRVAATFREPAVAAMTSN